MVFGLEANVRTTGMRQYRPGGSVRFGVLLAQEPPWPGNPIKALSRSATLWAGSRSLSAVITT
jgi:hypothetical protein